LTDVAPVKLGGKRKSFLAKTGFRTNFTYSPSKRLACFLRQWIQGTLMKRALAAQLRIGYYESTDFKYLLRDQMNNGGTAATIQNG
jgi:hypothetical protein